MAHRDFPYTGPRVPEKYDPLWQSYTNLSSEQILAFQGFPEALTIYTKTRRWHAEISSFTHGDMLVATQDRDQHRLTALVVAKAGPLTFFTNDGKAHALSAQDIVDLHTAMQAFIAKTYAVQSQLLTGIGNGTIKTRSQIDAAYAEIAPNSPSATIPGLF